MPFRVKNSPHALANEAQRLLGADVGEVMRGRIALQAAGCAEQDIETIMEVVMVRNQLPGLFQE